MIQTETVILKTFSIGDGLPYVGHCPHGSKRYFLLSGFFELETLKEMIQIETADVRYAIEKYDSPYEPEHKEMCIELKQYLAYLESSLAELETVPN